MAEIIGALTAVIILSIIYMLRLRAASNKLTLLQRVIDETSEAVVITGPDSIITQVNPAMCSITGYKREELIGKNPSIMQSGRQDKEFYEHMWSTLKETGKWSGEVWDKRKDGTHFPKLLSITAHKNKSGKVLRYIGTFKDITQSKQSAEHIDFLLNHDNVTGLPNTSLLNMMLTNAMNSPLQKNRRLALMTLKILRHKGVIEGFGFIGWNQLLKDSAQRLKETVGEGNIVARTGTDEFTIVIKSIDTPQKAAAFAKKISGVMAEVIVIKGQYIHIGTCIGVSLSPSDTTNPELLQIYSLRALAIAREKGINHYELYSLKDMGIALSIDDFGTGYSSLGYLRQFPVDSIKMDISFVREIGKSKDGETIARTIIELAHNLGFKALAEGVETKEQLDFLMAHHCDDMQGFYFSKPKPPELFAKDLRAGHKLFKDMI